MNASDSAAMESDFPRFAPADLTIALCTIGRPGYLQAALDSLVRTTPSEVSLLVVLNGCTPATRVTIAEQLGKWDGPVEVVEVEDRLPVHESHNTALRACKTALITFMGDDDLAIEPRVNRLLALFDLEPMPLVVASFAKRTGGTAEEPVFFGHKDLGPTSIAEWEQWRADGELFELCFPSAIFVTEAARSVGGFEGKFGPTMDVGIFTRLSRRGPVISDPRRTFGYRVHDGSLSTADGSTIAELLRYVGVCAAAMDAGETEPTFVDFQAAERGEPRRTRLVRRLRVGSQVRFRRAGAATLRGNRVAGAGHLALSAASSPRVFVRKVRDQVGRPSAAELVTPIRRKDPEWVTDVDSAVAALPVDAPVVTILIKGLHTYRVMFYEHLRSVLAGEGVRLRLVHGQGTIEDRAKGDVTRLNWSEDLPVRTIMLGHRELLWQNGVAVARESDLVVCEQASRLLLNYVLLAARPFLGFRLALWGHGKNLRSEASTSGERVKRWFTNRAHWFFAYNRTSAAYVEALGVPPERITAVQNATDTRQLREARAAFTEADIATARAELGIGPGPVGFFMGGLYDLKRPQFLLDAAFEIRKRIPGFELIVIGQGPEELIVKEAAREHDWIHYPGGVFGTERVRYGALSDVFLLPGLVGLNIVDAFALGLPVISCALPYHAPEIEYLVDGTNGVFIDRDVTPAEFGAEAAELLADAPRLAALHEGALESAGELTIERMAQRYADGLMQALRTPRR